MKQPVDHRSKIAKLTGRVGSFKRWDPTNVDGLIEAQRAVTVAKIEQAIDEIMSSAPAELSDDDIVYLTAFIQNLYERSRDQ